MKASHYINIVVSIMAAIILIIFDGSLTEWILLYGFISLLYFFTEAIRYFSKSLEQQTILVSSIQGIKEEIIKVRDSIH